MSSVGVAIGFRIPESRAKRMQDELQFALRQVSKGEIATWGIASGGRLGVGLWRRGKSLCTLAKKAGTFAVREVSQGVRAHSEHRFGQHAKARSKRLADLGVKAGDWAKVKVRGFPDAVRSLRENPTEQAPKVLGAALGFLSGSGGFDANGGILSPDVDLLFGIGAHRSVLSHSLILGAAAEATILSVIALAKLIHDKLPANHDPFWDQLAMSGESFAKTFATGYGLGLAYHLGVDGTIQAAPLHGIPVPMPMEGHQVVMVSSAISEALNQTESEPCRSTEEAHRDVEEKHVD